MSITLKTLFVFYPPQRPVTTIIFILRRMLLLQRSEFGGWKVTILALFYTPPLIMSFLCVDRRLKEGNVGGKLGTCLL